MKAVILAGGMGTRFSEETSVRPKPMIGIGGKPILWHIMKIYSSFGINEFIICCGYKGYMIKEYFSNYALHNSDVTFDMASNEEKVHHNMSEPWKVTLVDTGDSSGTGGRLRRVRSYLADKDFCFTYGDGVSNVNISKLIAFHKKQGTLATLTAIRPPSKYGVLRFDGSRITSFQEKPSGGEGWINGGFFVLQPAAIDYVETDEMHWERGPMAKIVAHQQFSAYKHDGFWQCMDTQRDKNYLEGLWASGRPPWKVWD